MCEQSTTAHLTISCPGPALYRYTRYTPGHHFGQGCISISRPSSDYKGIHDFACWSHSSDFVLPLLDQTTSFIMFDEILSNLTGVPLQKQLSFRRSHAIRKRNYGLAIMVKPRCDLLNTISISAISTIYGQPFLITFIRRESNATLNT